MISLDYLGRIGTFQWVTENPNKKILSHVTLCLKCRTPCTPLPAERNLVQLYTGLALRGHGIVEEILEGLSRAVEARGVDRIGELVGAQASAWAQRERSTADEDAYVS